MATRSENLDGARIRELFDDLSLELDRAGVSDVELLVVVGGSYLALHRLRDATRDVDSARPLSEALIAAARLVAARHDLNEHWLNDSAAGFVPAGLDLASCEVLHESPQLRVLGPSPDFVFLMKLSAARTTDHRDMAALWPRCSFGSPAAAVAAFYDGYPLEERDEHLEEFVADIVGAGD